MIVYCIENGKYGVEMVINGGFDTGSNWNVASGITISGGKSHFDGTESSYPGITQIIGDIRTKMVRITLTISNRTQGSIFITPGMSGSSFRFPASNGTHSVIQEWNGSSARLYLRSSNSFIGSIDNISVKEVLSP